MAAQAYEFCVKNFNFDTELDTLIGTIQMMPHFIETQYIGGRKIYVVPNETTVGENFAERWNTEPARVKAFYDWHAKALSDFESIGSLEGIDLVTNSLETTLGDTVVKRVMDARMSKISGARASQSLYVAPSVGLTLSSSAYATPVRHNTHFGD